MVKEKTLTLTNILLIILIVILFGYIGYSRYTDWQNEKISDAYRQGVLDAQTAINNQIIQELNTNGYVVFTFLNSQNQTQSVRLGIIQENTD